MIREIDAYSYSASNTFGLGDGTGGIFTGRGEAWLEELLVYLQGNVEVVSEWCQKHNVGFTAPQVHFMLAGSWQCRTDRRRDY